MWINVATALTALVIPLGLDLYMPVPEANPITPDKIAIGRQLFFDPRLSRDRSRSCASCHQPTRAFSDGRAVAVGVGNRVGRRNAPAIVNRGYGRRFLWDGRAAALEQQVPGPISDPMEMDLPVEEAARRVGRSVDEMSTALASYVRSILSGNSRFDRFVDGERNALTPVEQLGLQIFRGKGNCTACHVGPNFTDERMHNTGVAWHNGILADEGAGRGTFKTPTLREIERTAPYMHDGSLPTLEAVVTFYSDGGRPNPHLDAEIRSIQLTDEEKRALVALLVALSGDVSEGVPAR